MISQTHLSFDPLKPVILRGGPEEDVQSVFSGNVVLSLPKPTKISSVSVTFKSTATTYWPEGIGIRGTRLTSEKVLSEENVQVLTKTEDEQSTKLPAGTHRFPFVFLVPNSVVETIEDMYGRVRHTVEARVTRPGIQLLNSWHVSKHVLILRTYMSNSLLTNNSVQDLSRTLEKRITAADIQVVIEQAAFSPGEAFSIRTVVQPQRKHVRIESMDLVVSELNRYLELEMRAQRNGHEKFSFEFRASTALEIPEDTTEALHSLFDKHNGARPIKLDDTFAHRLTFATPTCHQNLHHTTTHYKEIQFRHYLTVTMTISSPDDGGTTTPPLAESLSSSTVSSSSSSPVSTPPASTADMSMMLDAAAIGGSAAGWHNVLSKFRVSRNKNKEKNRVYDTIVFEVPISVFDCRLKEDFGRLPSYFDLGSVPRNIPKKPKHKHSKEKAVLASERGMPEIDKPHIPPHTFLCSCYHDFALQMQYASQAPFLVTTTLEHEHQQLERIPSRPPPEYA
ncbi:hypothetical protein BDB00DRAFT_567794 [Zychaea mexicana]|uniref:uncharacterized protein n=1 Tax=Zychaea mexicana TaxID=64656 RepID=UPI0022FE2D9F|nr:uncharacterized protein BDB00DRAFT_567794 [Zychaea mexicana]KAI9490058.1 hypothetical protein BDB00DRAFT_567794 [Zychaea mexicana]